jgi:hypothetical protein
VVALVFRLDAQAGGEPLGDLKLRPQGGAALFDRLDVEHQPVQQLVPVVAGAGRDEPVQQGEQAAHVLKGELQRLHLLDQPEPLDVVVGDDPAALYFEVPDGRYLLANGEPWDVIYDHPAHFSPPVLRHLFERNGFTVQGIATAFADQYLQVEAVPAAVPGPAAVAAEEVAAVADLVDAFGQRVQRTISDACRHLDELLTSGAAVALWGAGAKGVTYLNLIDPQGRIPVAVDLNPRKHGMHVPGTGTPILPPEHLRDAQPDVVLFTNPIYHAEIQDMLDQLDVTAKLDLI